MLCVSFSAMPLHVNSKLRFAFAAHSHASRFLRRSLSCNAYPLPCVFCLVMPLHRVACFAVLGLALPSRRASLHSHAVASLIFPMPLRVSASLCHSSAILCIAVALLFGSLLCCAIALLCCAVALRRAHSSAVYAYAIACFTAPSLCFAMLFASSACSAVAYRSKSDFVVASFVVSQMKRPFELLRHCPIPRSLP